MLTILFGKCPELNFKTSKYFDLVFKPEWLKDDLNKQMILDIDKSEVIDSYLIKSPVLGMIPPQYLSGGVKTLILINQIDNEIFNASQCGDNCADWLLEIGKIKNRIIWMGHTMDWVKYNGRTYSEEYLNVRLLSDKGNIEKYAKTAKDIMEFAIEYEDADFEEE